MIHTQGLEALLCAKGLRKSQLADRAGVSASFLADLLAHRGGASDHVARRLCRALDVEPAVLFPELAGWVSPLPDRRARRADAI